MTAVSLWSQAAETVTSTGAGNAGTIGLHFTVSDSCTLEGLWLYSPSGHSMAALPASIGLYTTQSSPSTGTLVTSNTATWLTGPGGSSAAAGSGWVYAAFTSPPALASGTNYMAVAYLNSTSAWFCYDEPYTWPASSSPVTAPKDTGNGQGWYNNTTTTSMTFPSTQLAGYNWWLDVSVSTATARTATAALAVSPSETASAERTAAERTATASLAVTPAGSASASGGPAWDVLQSAAETTADTVTELSVTYGSGLTAGTVMLAAVSFWNDNAAGAISTVKDGAGNSFTQVAIADLGTSTVRGTVSLWALATPAGDAGTKPAVTATWTGGTGATGASIVVQEVSAISAAPDGTAGTASAAGASSITPSAYSSSAAGGYLVAVFGDDGGPETAAQAGSGYTLDANSQNNNGNSDVVVAYKSSTGGAESGGWTMSGTLPSQGAILVAFPLAGAGRSASASLGVAPSLSAAASAEHAATASAALDVTPGMSATAGHGATASAALDLAPVTSAGASHGQHATASLAVDPSLSAAAQKGVPHDAAAVLGVTPAASAAGSAGAVARTGSASLAVALSVSAAAPPPFPASPLDLRCDFNLAGTWTDVSSYAYQREGTSPPIVITRGRPDESSQVNPATCAWELNNRDGRFSPKNPLSPYYGQLGRNTPVRWSVAAGSAYLRLENDNADRAYVNDDSSIDITGSIEVRLALRLTDWQGGMLAHKWDGGACWLWYLNTDGTMQFTWYDGTSVWRGTSTVPLPYTGSDFALRVTMDASTGTVTFYTAAGTSLSGTWTQLGDPVSPTGGASTSITTNSGSAFTVGYTFSFSPGQVCGRVYEAQLWDGLAGDSGTLAADGTYSAQSAGTASWTDAQGNTWNLAGGAEISDRDYRFHGEMSSQPPKWDVTGKDMSVMAQAGGPLRRLSQGSNNAMSAMRRAIGFLSGDYAPVAYWPMEDAAGATRFGSAIGPYPMTFTSPAPKLAGDSSFTASAPLPTLNGSILQGQVAPYTSTGTWTVRFLLKLSDPSVPATFLRIVTQPGAACPVVYLNIEPGGGAELIGYAPDGSEAFNTGYIGYALSGQELMVSVEAVPVSGGTQYNLVTVAPGASTGAELPTAPVVSGSAGNVTDVQPDITGAFGDTVIGHCYVQSAWQSLFTLGQPLSGWTGETAGARYARLAAENGYACRILGSPAYSAAMGPQGQATLQDLLQECETADLGQQYEPRQQTALGYRTLASMCNQSPVLTLDYTASEPGGVNGDGTDSGLDPTYDDQLTKNDWTVTRGAASGDQGGTWQYQLNDGSPMSVSDPPDGAGDYANTATVNVESDTQLPDVAGWLVHAGTVDEARWPVIPLNLARTETTALQQDALALEVGDMLQVDDAPDLVVTDPVRQLALGMKESLGGFHWTMEFNAVPESPYEVIVLDDPVYGRADTDGSYLFDDIGESDTSFSVVTPNAQLVTWTTDPADFPFDIGCEGERMTVTGISGTGVSTQTFTVTRAVNGVAKSHPANADVRLWFAPVLALT